VGVFVTSDDFSEGRAKETVDPCIDLASVIGGGTRGVKVISEPRREPSDMETAASGAGALEREFSEDDECTTSMKRR
jgi:hypothetical protein